ncbi:phage baseplate assembly protein [Escherichia coli]|nr:phage baseplate assembly protein [Escherichia coli]
MAVSDQTRSGDLAETFKSERETTKNQIRVALPGIVQSFAPDAVTAVVQPAIRYVEIDNDGNRITKNYPLLVDVPVVFPRGGGCTLTFPVTCTSAMKLIVSFLKRRLRLITGMDGMIRFRQFLTLQQQDPGCECR